MIALNDDVITELFIVQFAPFTCGSNEDFSRYLRTLIQAMKNTNGTHLGTTGYRLPDYRIALYYTVRATRQRTLSP